MLTVDRHGSDVCCDEFPVPQIDRKSKLIKQHVNLKFFICSQYGEQLAKLEAIKNAICWHFLPYLLNICRKFEFLIYQGSVATCIG